jgi:hypothetical protein
MDEVVNALMIKGKLKSTQPECYKTLKPRHPAALPK